MKLLNIDAWILASILVTSLEARHVSPQPRDSSTAPVVLTTSGTVRGVLDPENGVSAYLGIPYAVPPVGALRWQAPRPYLSNAEIDATHFGFSCYQSSPTAAEPSTPGPESNITEAGFAMLLAMSTYGLPESEDCLTLNVWAKKSTLPSRPKAVMLFVHGGSFVAGSSAMPSQNGRSLAAEHADEIIVVSINYRLNILGFPGSPALPRQNLGVLDARMALEWVRDNIAQFGGDPERITLFGQSAGGSMTDILSYAYPDDPIAAGFIMMSGFAQDFGLQGVDAAMKSWDQAAVNAGCSHPHNPSVSTATTSAAASSTLLTPVAAHDSGDQAQSDILACMLSLPAVSLISAIPLDGISSAGLPFGPVTDDILVFTNYTAHGPATRPVLLGTADREADLYRFILPPDLTPPQEVLDSITDSTFTCPAALRAGKSRRLGNPTWRYRWFGNFPNTILAYEPFTTGAWHGSDVPSIFDTIPQSPIPNTPEQDAVMAYHRGAFVAFAKDPAHGLDTYFTCSDYGAVARGRGWPHYHPGEQTLVRIGYENRTGTNLAMGAEYDGGC
ncbi:Alpha/Beta hydrolase protein [Microdochium bolleyi]|uniref:Carboxylic ester hydrolase n=1 Tax=Microdochium bolleyi TaxID=196109 RepID=A0A136J880_9PEZI|nr:Alpha/Beta hydrolase protein [Microdochium bolleyi]